MTALVCGGRNMNNRAKVFDVLDSVDASRRITKVVTGGATGADQLAIDWAEARSRPFDVYLANWSEHGRAAGPIRNRLMLEQSSPDVVVAFPGGTGTADMVRRAQKAGVQILRG